MVAFIGKANEPVPTGQAADWIGHDLRRLAGREFVLEQRDQNIFIYLWAKITNEDGVLRATVITAKDERGQTYAIQTISTNQMEGLPSVGKTTTRSPIQLEGAVGIGDQLAIKRQCLCRSRRGREVDEAISGVTPVAKSVTSLPLLRSRFIRPLTRRTCRESF